MRKNLLVIFLICTMSLIFSGYQKPDTYVIDAEKNAYFHNNLGLRDMDEENYVAAIQEFKLAISLNPNKQATAVYYNNLGEAYMKLGLYKYALDCFEKAKIQYDLNFSYYLNLAKCYKKLNLLDSKIKTYSTMKGQMAKVMLGLLYVQKGDLRRGITKLDQFCAEEPELLITPAIKDYIEQITTKY